MKGKKDVGVKPVENLKSGVYAGEGSSVVREARNKAEAFKKGGKVHKKGKTVMKVEGEKEHRMDRKPRKSGGGVFSSASKIEERRPSSHY